MVRRDPGRMIVDTLGRIVLVLIRVWWGGLRRIDKTCGRAVRPLKAGLSLVYGSCERDEEEEMIKERRTHPLGSKQT
jgi:hypothetical protein